MRWTLAVLGVLVLVGCGGRSEHARAVDPDAAYAHARIAADHRGMALREAGEPAGDRAARRTAQSCLSDWKAAPPELADEGPLLTLWTAAVTRSAYLRQRPSDRKLVRDLAMIPGVDAKPRLRVARTAITRSSHLLDAMYAEPIDTCAVVRSWRRRAWSRPLPATLARLIALERELDAVSDHHGWLSLPEHGGYCGDAVFETLDEGDTFCG